MRLICPSLFLRLLLCPWFELEVRKNGHFEMSYLPPLLARLHEQTPKPVRVQFFIHTESEIVS